MPPNRSVTTHCSAMPDSGRCPIRSPMAHQNNGNAGSPMDLNPDPSALVTLFPRAAFDRIQSACHGEARTVKRFLRCPSGGMVDAGDSKSPAARLVGSSPTSGTKRRFVRIAGRRLLQRHFDDSKFAQLYQKPHTIIRNMPV